MLTLIITLMPTIPPTVSVSPWTPHIVMVLTHPLALTMESAEHEISFKK